MFTDFSVVNKALRDTGYLPAGISEEGINTAVEVPGNSRSKPPKVKMGQAWKGPAVVLIVPFKKTCY